MMRRCISLLLMLMVLPAFAEEIVTPAAPFTGWSWYNEPKKKPQRRRQFSLSLRSRACRT